ncbi:MAG: DHH family phosphoesterase, partial [Bacteroidales bacterium]|nr:DHH family phosphoesterase [Bacteroidales bacterium]
APPARGTSMSRYYDKEISNSDLVFSLGPRLNAAGRVSDGKYAVRLMICKRMDEAEKIARIINTINTERKNLDHTAYQEALEMIVDKTEENRASTVVFDAAWSQGIVGIVASRLTETFYRPTIVFTTADADKNTLVGSARSVKSFNIYEAISACADMGLIDHFGGHKYAAGLTIRLENYEKFKEAFEKIVNENFNGEEPQQEIEIDDVLTFEQITPELVAAVKEFAPFGPKNLNPLFITKDVLAEKVSRIKEKHLKLLLFQQNSHTKRFESIAFKQSDAFERIARNKPFDVCYHLEENSFNGNTSIQLNIQDMHFPE